VTDCYCSGSRADVGRDVCALFPGQIFVAREWIGHSVLLIIPASMQSCETLR
jgi:hypothetical protein